MSFNLVEIDIKDVRAGDIVINRYEDTLNLVERISLDDHDLVRCYNPRNGFSSERKNCSIKQAWRKKIRDESKENLEQEKELEKSVIFSNRLLSRVLNSLEIYSKKNQRYHILRIELEYYKAILNGSKTFEIRINDRNYNVNDTVMFIPVENGSICSENYEEVIVEITYITDYMQKDDYVVWSFKRI